MNISNVNTKRDKLIGQCMNFNLDTAKMVIANLMVGDYDTDEQKQMHDALREWAVRNEAKLQNTFQGADVVAELPRWNMLINILDHISHQMHYGRQVHTYK